MKTEDARTMQELKLPEIGEGVVEGEIVRWLRQPGDVLALNDALLEVMTDKATVEIPSPVAGRIEALLVAEGDIVKVGAPILRLGEGAAMPAPPTNPAMSGAGAAAAAAPAASHGASGRGPALPATPAARALAREAGIDLATIPVDRGRITRGDVLAAQERGPVAPAPTPTTAPPPSAAAAAAAVSPRPAAPTAPATPSAPAPAPAQRYGREPAADEYLPFRGMRRVIAEGLTRSYSTAVHYTYVEQIDVTKLVALREQAKKGAAEQGVSLSYLPFIVKAIVHGLKRFPIVNSTLDEANQRIILRKRYHVGVAAATEQGLMVPVIRDADQLSLLDLAREIKRLGDGAKVGKLSREELTGSTFSITSLGQIGGVLATPIINFPEVGILGVHAIRKVPVVTDDDKIAIGHVMNLSVSLDHRVVDGFEGASFLQEVRRYLEDPTLLLLAGI
jgi:pyruvate dehydrogenase E2 component (dihydrolipoamide acetyltransferase)